MEMQLQVGFFCVHNTKKFHMSAPHLHEEPQLLLVCP